jgi:hypothetical protein
MKKAYKVWGLVAAILYVCAYVALSIQGRYEPGIVGLNGVKSYAWAPRGFASSQGRWNRHALMVFAPCYLLDCRVWHTADWRTIEKYPVHKMEPEEVVRTYLMKEEDEPSNAAHR